MSLFKELIERLIAEANPKVTKEELTESITSNTELTDQEKEELLAKL